VARGVVFRGAGIRACCWADHFDDRGCGVGDIRRGPAAFAVASAVVIGGTRIAGVELDTAILRVDQTPCIVGMLGRAFLFAAIA